MSRIDASQSLPAPPRAPAHQSAKPSSEMAGRVKSNPDPMRVSARAGVASAAVQGDYSPVSLHQRKAAIPATPIDKARVELKYAPVSGNTHKEISTMMTLFEQGCVSDQMASQTSKKIEETGRFPKAERAKFQKAVQKNVKRLDDKKLSFTQMIQFTAQDVERRPALSFLKPVVQQQLHEAHVWNSIDQVFDYTEKAEKDLSHLTTLSNKLNKTGKLSKKEYAQFSQLLWTHKESMPILQGHLADLRASSSEKAGMTKILDSAITALADKHMALADMMSLHSDHLPDRPAISRDERADFHLLQAQAGREAIAVLKESFTGNKTKTRALDEIDQSLAAHEASLKELKEGNMPKNADDPALLSEMPMSKGGKISAKVKTDLERGWKNGLPLPVVRRDMTQEQMINLFLNHQLKSKGFDMSKLPDLKFLQSQGFVQAVNKKPWPKIDNQIDCQIGGHKRSFRSEITPAAVHSARLARPYQGAGISSGDRLQYDHAINLARTSLTNEAGDEIFTAHRSGVLDAYQMTPKNLAKMSDPQLQDLFKTLLVERGRSIKNPSRLVENFRKDPVEARRLAKLAREENSKMMAEDAATTMLLDDPALLARALAADEAKGEMVELPITSISLMTPDYLRELSSKSGEQTMLSNHKLGLDSLEGVIQLKVRNQAGDLQQVRVRVRPRVMSFGVNAGALRGLGVVSGNRVPFWRRAMGWGLSAQLNDPVLSDMVGGRDHREIGGQAAQRIEQLREQQNNAQQALRSSELSPDDRAQLEQQLAGLEKQESKTRQLALQVKELWNNGNYVREGRDPYKMAARVAMLSDALGEKTLFHCKSGKDRTGQLDAEAKYLSSVFDQTGFIPHPDGVSLSATRRLRTLFALKTGNHEMQRYNTGLAGFKLKGVPALDAQFEPSALPNYRGGSGFVKS